MKKFLAITAGASTIIALIILGISFYLSTKFVTQPKTTQEIRTKAAPASTISFSPGTVTASPNETFTLDATIDPGLNLVTAVELHITFDPTVLSASSVTNGSAFPNVFPAFSGQSPYGPVIDNTNGTITFIVGTQQTQPVTTSSTVATISFLTKSQASISSVSFADTTVASALQEATNVITSRIPTTVSVVSSTPTPTNTPTPTPTATPIPTATPTPLSTLTPTPTPLPSGTITPTPTPLAGDLDHNNVVNIYDYNIMVQNFGQTNCGNAADIDGNCLVNIYDYNLLVQNYGRVR